MAALFLAGCGAAPDGTDDGETTATDQSALCPAGSVLCGAGKIKDFDGPIVSDGWVEDCGGVKTASIQPSVSTIEQGETATISWSLSTNYACSPTITLNGVKVAASGSQVVKPMSSTTYVLSLNGTVAAQTTLNVKLPPVVRILGNTAEWKQLFIQALSQPLDGYDHLPPDQRPGRTVSIVGNLELDLTGLSDLKIDQGVTLTSEMPPIEVMYAAGSKFLPITPKPGPARSSTSLGPRIYTNSVARPLFHIRCGDGHYGDRVRITGVRIQGPHMNHEDSDSFDERGIQITSCKGIEIDDIEISGFSESAIFIQDPSLARNESPSDVVIKNSFIHNNQHEGQWGYGVNVSHGAQATIEHNVFDFNRHAIKASGTDTAYRALANLVLKGGGIHGKFYNEYTHQFDVHGTDSCWLGHLNCGTAGIAFEYMRNTFQYTSDLSIKVRGTPVKYAWIANNVFAKGEIGDAVDPTGNSKVEIWDNTLGKDSYGDYGVCDFDADGKQDLFLATGRTWWLSSAGKREWRFLNERTETRDEIGLGDFDGDGRCDVFTTLGSKWVIFQGGKTQVVLGDYGVPISELAFGDFDGDDRTDIFRRAPNGQWWAISPGVYGWEALQSSAKKLSDLRFGDFDGNGKTDVLAIDGGYWSVSWDARSPWYRLPGNVTTSLTNVVIGNIDGSGGDEVVRAVPVLSGTTLVGMKFEVASGSQPSWSWQPLVTFNGSSTSSAPLRAYVGRFDAANGADLLVLDGDRMGRIYSYGQAGFGPHGFYAH